MASNSTNDRKRHFCGHCEEYLSKTLFYRHKRLYYNSVSKKWSSERVVHPVVTEDKEFICDAVTSRQSREDEYDKMLTEDMSAISADLQSAESLHSEDNQDDFISELSSDNLESDFEGNSDESGPELWTDIAGEDFSFESDEGAQASQTPGPLTQESKMFLTQLSKLTSNNTLQQFCDQLPQDVHKARLGVSAHESNFKKYVCCPKCFAIYPWNLKPSSESLSCSHVQFPLHPQRQHRKACGKQLYKEVKLSCGTIKHYPILTFCYKSIIESLQEMLYRPKFFQQCEAWRSRNIQEGKYNDVYDGKVWQDFMSYDGQPFLSLPFNFAFQLNIDWFQPFQHTQHSEGMMYLAVMNLPRTERFLQENIILVGVLPGPKEPQKNVNSFLEPLVHDLLDLWNGVILYTREKTPMLVRAALLCVACDIPAARKTCGFVGHGAVRGCSKCLLTFPTAVFGEKPDYSNFNRSEWIPRSCSNHREAALKHKASNTKSSLQAVERESGVRYSILLELPYFDPPTMCIVDPMHNLFLGTAKKMVMLWKELELLSESKLIAIQQKVDAFVSPSGMGRLPSKIASGFSGFTADQWKNWTLYFSLFALKGELPRHHYECWHLFVKACSFLCCRSISRSDVNDADRLFEEFCQHFVSVYGNEHCTMNMHLHCHLKECVEDYGPVYAFWLFAFERMNGIMGSYHTNNRSISVQLARRFMDNKEFDSSKWPTEFIDDFFPLLDRYRYQQGSLMQNTLEIELSSPTSVLLAPVHEIVWQPHQIIQLNHIVEVVSGLSRENFEVHTISKQAKAIKCGKDIFSGCKSKHTKSSVVFAHNLQSSVTTLAEVYFFAECTFQLNSTKNYNSIWVVALKWYMDHPCKVWYGLPTQVWSCTQCSQMEFVPISFIKSRCVYTKALVNFGQYLGTQDVMIATPIKS